MGLRRGDFKAIGVITDLTKATGGPASPCGMCRQVMREFFTPEVEIYMFYSEGGHIMKTMEEVCAANPPFEDGERTH
jgi:cytidine deaminase